MNANELPPGWVRLKLHEAGDWFGGGTPSKNRPDFWTGGTIPWISPKDMKAPRLADSEDHITPLATAETNVRKFPANTVLVVVRSGILSRTLPVAVVEVPATMNQDMKGIRPCEAVEADYLAHFLRANELDILRRCSKSGTTVASIEVSRLYAYELPVAPLAEQRRIVARIEELFAELDAAVEELERVRANLKRYRASVLKAAVTGDLTADWRATHSPRKSVEQSELPELWQVKSLRELILSLNQGWSPKCDAAPSADELEWGVIKTTAIQHMQFVEVENKRLPAKLVPRQELELCVGDLLITRAGPRVRAGVTCLVRSVRRRLILCDKAYRMRVNAALASAGFLELALNSTIILREIEAMKSGISDSGVNLTQDKFLALLLPLPPLAEQEAIVLEVEARLSDVTAAEAAVNANLTRAARLRQSILKEAFAGRLVPQDPADEPAAVLLERIRNARAGTSTTPSRTKPMRGRPRVSRSDPSTGDGSGSD